MVFSIVTMLCCVLLILFISFILYQCLKEIEIIEKNLKYLQIQMDEVNSKHLQTQIDEVEEEKTEKE